MANGWTWKRRRRQAELIQLGSRGNDRRDEGRKPVKNVCRRTPGRAKRGACYGQWRRRYAFKVARYKAKIVLLSACAPLASRTLRICR